MMSCFGGERGEVTAKFTVVEVVSSFSEALIELSRSSWSEAQASHCKVIILAEAANAFHSWG